MPADFRNQAKVVQLNWFVLDENRRVRPSMVAAHKIH